MAIYFNEQFDIIVYCIVDTVHTLLAGINLVIFEAACQLKKDPSLMLPVQNGMGEKFFKSSDISAKYLLLCSAF